MLKALIQTAEYKRLRAICDTADSYWKEHATHGRSGSSMSAELAAAPEYSACSNEIRGMVEQFEILQNPPERLAAYIGADEHGRPLVTVWTGLPLGCAHVTSKWRVDSYMSRERFAYSAMIGGREYHGRGFGKGMFVSLKETAASKRKRESN